jgi:hypothetical protein
MADGFGIVLLTLLTGVSLIALFFGYRLLFPRVVERSRLAADRSPGRAFTVGLVNFLFFGAVGLGFATISDGAGGNLFLFPAMVILAVLSVGIFIGLTGIVLLLGERMMPEQNLRRQTFWGGVVIILASLTPFIGWFIFFPYVGLVGLGGFIIGWFRRNRIPARDMVPED